MSDCPSDNVLTEFLNESLPEGHLHGVSVHVDGCAVCQKRLDRLTHHSAAAGARLQARTGELTMEVRTPENQPDAGTFIVTNAIHPKAHLIGLPSIPGFDVIEEIGRGGMGVVYRARHLRLNRLVALKMILAGSAADARVVQRFLFEAEILARVQHPQVVQVYEVGTFQGPTEIPIPYLAMEILEGGSLSWRLRRAAREAATGKPSRTEPRHAAQLIEGVARAVHSVHVQGVVHRDLKPGNILFSADAAGRIADEPSSGDAGRSGLPKVTDFGLAKFTQDAGADLTGSGQVIGTPQYMAPEQATGKGQIGPAADVYALGAILFECLAGRRPFEGSEAMSVLLKVVNDPPPPIESLCPGLNRDLAAVVMRCLAKEPRRRYVSAADLADDLRRYLDRRPTIARPIGRAERAWLWAARNPSIAGLMTALGAVLLASFITVTLFWVKAEQKARDERTALAVATGARKDADDKRITALVALDEANRQRRAADLNRAHLEFSQAVSWCEEGHIHQGLDSFVRTVELAESVGEANLARAARVNLAAWPRDLAKDREALVHTHQPRDIAFFPDGTRAAVAARGGRVFLWDTVRDQKLLTYKPRFSLARVTASGFSLAFSFWTVAVSPDGKTMAAAGSDGLIWVWDEDNPEARFTLDGAPPEQNVWAIAFAPDGTLWSANGAAVLIHWDLKARKAIGRSAGPNKSNEDLQCLAIAPDGKHVYTGDRRGYCVEWDTDRTVPIRSWKLLERWVSGIAVSPDGRLLAATGNDGTVRLLNLVSDREIQQFSLARAYGKGLAFSPTQPRLVVTDMDGNIRGWNWKSGAVVGVPLQLVGEVLAPRFFPNSDEFAVPAGNTIHRCRLPDPPGKTLLDGEAGPVLGFDFSPAGDRLAVALPHQVREYSLANSLPLDSRTARPELSVSLRYDPNPVRQRLIRAFPDGFDLMSLPGFSSVQTIWDRDRVADIAIALADGRIFALHREFITSWDPQKMTRAAGRFRDEEMPQGLDMQTIDLRADGREVMTAYGNKVIFLDPVTLTKTRPGWDVADAVIDAKYMPGGTAVLVGRRDSVAQVLNAETGAAISRELTHSRAVLSVAAGPDGRTLLTGSRDGTARFWDTATGLPLGPPLRHAGPVTRVRFHPRGDLVATGTREGELLLSSIPPPPLGGTIEDLRKAGK